MIMRCFPKSTTTFQRIQANGVRRKSNLNPINQPIARRFDRSAETLLAPRPTTETECVSSQVQSLGGANFVRDGRNQPIDRHEGVRTAGVRATDSELNRARHGNPVPLTSTEGGRFPPSTYLPYLSLPVGIGLMTRWLPLLIFVAALLPLSGCGKKLTPVSGVVTLDGKPVADATVTFVSDDGKYTSTGATDESGNFALSSGAGPGAYEGNYKVTVAKYPKVEGSAPTGAPGADKDYMNQMKGMDVRGSGQAAAPK